MIYLTINENKEKMSAYTIHCAFFQVKNTKEGLYQTESYVKRLKRVKLKRTSLPTANTCSSKPVSTPDFKALVALFLKFTPKTFLQHFQSRQTRQCYSQQKKKGGKLLIAPFLLCITALSVQPENVLEKHFFVLGE